MFEFHTLRLRVDPRLKSVGFLGVWVVLLAGCAPYQLQGIVLPGPAGSMGQIEVVGSKDPRLEQEGLASAQISVTLDPTRLNRKALGRGSTGPTGQFAIPIDEGGAGFLEHEVELIVTRPGYQTASEIFILPAASRRVVVTLPPGKDQRRLDRSDLLDETLDEAQRYLQD
jgi:hypothetical protein